MQRERNSYKKISWTIKKFHFCFITKIRWWIAWKRFFYCCSITLSYSYSFVLTKILLINRYAKIRQKAVLFESENLFFHLASFFLSHFFDWNVGSKINKRDYDRRKWQRNFSFAKLPFEYFFIWHLHVNIVALAFNTNSFLFCSK